MGDNRADAFTLIEEPLIEEPADIGRETRRRTPTPLAALLVCTSAPFTEQVYVI